MVSRCSSSRRWRTAGTVATGLTAAVASAERIATATSSPSSVMVGSSGSVPETISGSAAWAATASASSTSIPWRSIHTAIARNWAPVSR
jgi:hypothetical protein